VHRRGAERAEPLDDCTVGAIDVADHHILHDNSSTAIGNNR
jgi:hypothetical protein